METIVRLANEFWNLWLGLLFVSILIYTIWPSKKRNSEMDHAANIPLLDDEPNSAKGA